VRTRGQISVLFLSVKLKADLCYAPQEGQVTKHVAWGVVTVCRLVNLGGLL